MIIADSQVHIWSANTAERPWPQGLTSHRGVPFGADDLLREMNAAGVDRTVIVPSELEAFRNDLALLAARTHPARFRVMGRFDVDAPGVRDKIKDWCAEPGMVGMRFAFHTPLLQPILTEGRMNWLWAAAAEAAIPLMVLVPHSLLGIIGDVAVRHPTLKVALDHLGLSSSKRDEEAFRDLDELLKLGRYPNIAVKASGLPCYTTDKYPYRRLHSYMRKVYDAFGPKRIFWGSNLTRLPCPYRHAITMFTEEMPWLTSEDIEWIMGQALCEWLGWPID